MNLNVSAIIATERHAQLIREAAAWRRGREAKHASDAERLHTTPVVYCARAAAGVRSMA